MHPYNASTTTAVPSSRTPANSWPRIFRNPKSMYMRSELQMLAAFIVSSSPVPGGSSTSTTTTPPSAPRTAFTSYAVRLRGRTRRCGRPRRASAGCAATGGRRARRPPRGRPGTRRGPGGRCPVRPTTHILSVSARRRNGVGFRVGGREPVIDVDRLVRWMDDEGLAGKGEPVEHRFISGGSQNEIYEIHRGDLHAALRMPPPGAPEARDDGILREWRIIEALDGTDVPHTPAIAACKDPSVLGRPFYLMGFVDGWSPMGMENREWPAPFDSDVDARQGLAYQLVEGIALLG